MEKHPFVSVIIPCYNEREYIGRCLDSLINNDYPHDRLEILVYDGMSEDGTRDVLREYEKRYPFIKFRDNPHRVQVKALNMGIKEAEGEIIIRCDAHAEYPEDYISTIVRYLMEGKADHVGGVWETQPGTDTLMAKAIVTVATHPFGVGFAFHRTKTLKKPTYVKYVPFGGWKREIFDEVGYFDEEFIRNQDLEFDIRLRKHGKRVMLVPSLRIKYYIRKALKKTAAMLFQYACAKVAIYRKHKTFVGPRTIIPFFFVLGIPFAFIPHPVFTPLRCLYGLYFAIGFSIGIYRAIKDRVPAYVFLLPFLFFVFHTSYGLGYIKGIWDFYIRRKPFSKGWWEVTR